MHPGVIARVSVQTPFTTADAPAGKWPTAPGIQRWACCKSSCTITPLAEREPGLIDITKRQLLARDLLDRFMTLASNQDDIRGLSSADNLLNGPPAIMIDLSAIG
jgi:hypothetical protein